MSAMESTIKVGIDATELEALKQIPTDAGAMYTLLASLANRGHEITHVDPNSTEERRFLWDGSRERFAEITPHRRPNITFEVSKLEHLAAAVARFGGSESVVQISPLGIHATLNPKTTHYRDSIRVPFYRDPLLLAVGSPLTLEELTRHLERLGNSVEDGSDLLAVLKMVTVQEVKDLTLEELGAHTRITATAKTSVQGSRDGAPVDIPNRFSAAVAFGTPWTDTNAEFRVRVEVDHKGLRFTLVHENAVGCYVAWIDDTTELLEGLIEDGDAQGAAVWASSGDFMARCGGPSTDAKAMEPGVPSYDLTR